MSGGFEEIIDGLGRNYFCEERDSYFVCYSCATLVLSEGADRNTISHLLDHENLSTVDSYAGREDDSKVVKVMEILRLQ